jgi:hypothetical protein
MKPVVFLTPSPIISNFATFNGTGRRGHTILLLCNGKPCSNAANVGTDGRFTVRSTRLGSGTYSFSVIQTDSKNLESEPVDAGNGTVLGPPVIVSATVAPGTSLGTITGTGKAGALLRLYESGAPALRAKASGDGALLGNTTVDTSGNWAMDRPGVVTGTLYTYSATQEDQTGVSDLSNKKSLSVSSDPGGATSAVSVPTSVAASTAAARSATMAVTASTTSQTSSTITTATNTATPTITAFWIDPPSAEAFVGDPKQFTAYGNFSDGSVRNMSSTGFPGTWNSSNTDYATISSSGLLSPLLNGSLIITASWGQFTADASVTIHAVAGFIVEPTAPYLILIAGSKLAFKVRFELSNGTITDPLPSDGNIWNSNNTNVANVTNAGVTVAKSAGVGLIKLTSLRSAITLVSGRTRALSFHRTLLLSTTSQYAVLTGTGTKLGFNSFD